MEREALWRLFDARICDLSTAKFLAERDLVDVFAPHTQSHAASEASALAARLRCADSFDSRELLSRCSRVVVSNCHLAHFSGSEVWTLDFASYLSAQGIEVMVHSPVLGAVADRIRARGIGVTSDPTDIAEFKPDLLHLNHFNAAASLLETGDGGAPVVNMIHGLLPRPALPGRERVRAYCAVSLHAQAKTHLLTGAPWNAIKLAPSFFDARRFLRGRLGPRGKRALLFSSKASAKHRELLSQMMSRAGYDLDHVGYGGVPSETPEKLLGNYGVVFAVGRSAVEALACGAQVILWDDGLIGPMVCADDFWSLVAANFSLASCTLPFQHIGSGDAENWLLDQLSLSRQGVEASEMAYEYLPMERVAPILLTTYRDALA